MRSVTTMKRLKATLVALSLAGAAVGAMAVVPARPAAAAGPPVFLVGDSVMQVFRFSYGKPGLAEVEKGYTVDLDAYQCRRLITLGCRPGPSALEVMRDPIHNPLPPVMVMTVGHNEKDDFPHKIDVIMQEARDRGVKTVVWLTYHNSIRATAYPGNNAAVKAAATRWPEMKVADWDAHAQGKGAAWFSTEDGLHLTPEGAIQYGRFIKSSIDTLAGGGTPEPPKPAPAKCDPATAIGTPAPALSNQPANPPAAGARITSMAPVRLLDTRAEGPDDGVVGRLGVGRALDIVVAGKVGVPANATGVIANVTAVEPCDSGFLTVYPAGSPPPLASSTNYRTSDVVAALVTVRLGTGGAISVYTHAQTDVVVDVVGYFHANQGTLYNAVDPFRLVDTRPQRWAAVKELRVPVRGVGTIPAGTGVTGAILNLTVTEPGAGGFLTVYPGPCNPANRPLSSNLNYVKDQTVANLVVAALGADGSVCIYSNVELPDRRRRRGLVGRHRHRDVRRHAAAPDRHPAGEPCAPQRGEGPARAVRALRRAGRDELRHPCRRHRGRAGGGRRRAHVTGLPHRLPVRHDASAGLERQLRGGRHTTQPRGRADRHQRQRLPDLPAGRRRGRRPGGWFK